MRVLYSGFGPLVPTSHLSSSCLEVCLSNNSGRQLNLVWKDLSVILCLMGMSTSSQKGFPTQIRVFRKLLKISVTSLYRPSDGILSCLAFNALESSRKSTAMRILKSIRGDLTQQLPSRNFQHLEDSSPRHLQPHASFIDRSEQDSGGSGMLFHEEY